MQCPPTRLSLLVCFCTSLVSVLVMASDPQPTSTFQAYILLQFKGAITNDPLHALQSWTNESTTTSPPPHFCHWRGINCGSQQQFRYSVVSIALPGLQLEGSITPLIGGLSSLVSIDLSNNSLSGFLPPALGLLSNLQSLKLSSNSFVGSIPASLSNCSFLALLDVSSNSMSGGIPAQLGALPRLEGLLLSHNLFDGTLPPSAFNASALQFLDISHNRIAGGVPGIVGNTKSLLSLQLASNNLTGPIPHTLSKLVSLQGLDVSNNMLNGGIPSELASFSHLAVVILGNNLLEGHIPAGLGSLLSLRVLQLNNNWLSGAIPSSLGNCKHLEDLVLSHNLLDGGIPTAVASLGNLLISFDMSYNQLTGPIPPQIGSMTQVLKIDLAHNNLSGIISEEISFCSGLEYLDLSNNQLKGPIPQRIRSLKSLTWMLNLSHNSLEGSIPDLQGLNYLRIVDLSSNNLDGSVPSSLSSLHSLMFFNLSFNNLIGCFIPVGSSQLLLAINLSWIQGNPNLCVPSLSHSCWSHACASRRRTHLLWLPWFLGFLLPIALLLGLGIGAYSCFSKLVKSSSCTISQDETALMLSRMSRFTTIYTAEHLNSAMNCIDASSLLGSGASSDVYRVQVGNGQICALKLFKPTARKQLFITELEVLANLRHRNLVSIKGYCDQGTTTAILLEYMENGSLKERLHAMPRRTLGLERRIQILRDVAEGLLYLHESNGGVPIIHCDVKSANILLDKEYKAHLADFGLATYAAGGLSNGRGTGQHRQSSTLLRLQGTVGYIAPEYGAFKTSPSQAGDVYSYGVVVLELLTGRPPGQGDFPPGIYSLPAFVRLARLDNNLASVLDPELKVQLTTRLDYDKVSLLASIGLDCASENAAKRPPIERVVSLLRSDPTFDKHNSE